MMRPLAAVLFLAPLLCAQSPSEADMTIDACTCNLVIDKAVELLNDYYVFPDVAKRMEAAVREHQKRGEYDSITSALTLQKQLEGDLRAVSKDKHLRVFYGAKPTPERAERERA